jgi:hypothetical protein
MRCQSVPIISQRMPKQPWISPKKSSKSKSVCSGIEVLNKSAICFQKLEERSPSYENSSIYPSKYRPFSINRYNRSGQETVTASGIREDLYHFYPHTTPPLPSMRMLIQTLSMISYTSSTRSYHGRTDTGIWKAIPPLT